MSKKFRNLEWGGPHPKDVVPPEESRASPARKNTRKWCRGKVGIPHQPTITMDKGWRSWMGTLVGSPKCRWWTSMWRGNKDLDYRCGHQRTCVACKKVLDHRVEPKFCPEYAPKPAVILCKCAHPWADHEVYATCMECPCERFRWVDEPERVRR